MTINLRHLEMHFDVLVRKRGNYYDFFKNIFAIT